MPISLIEAINSSSAAGSKCVRGWRGLGEIEEIGTSFCCPTSLSPTVNDVGINASRFVPKPPRRAIKRSHLHVCN